MLPQFDLDAKVDGLDAEKDSEIEHFALEAFEVIKEVMALAIQDSYVAIFHSIECRNSWITSETGFAYLSETPVRRVREWKCCFPSKSIYSPKCKAI